MESVLHEGPLYTRKVTRWLRQRRWKQRHFELIERAGQQPVLRCRRSAGGVVKSDLVVAPTWVIDTEPAGGDALHGIRIHDQAGANLSIPHTPQLAGAVAHSRSRGHRGGERVSVLILDAPGLEEQRAWVAALRSVVRQSPSASPRHGQAVSAAAKASTSNDIQGTGAGGAGGRRSVAPEQDAGA